MCTSPAQGPALFKKRDPLEPHVRLHPGGLYVDSQLFNSGESTVWSLQTCIGRLRQGPSFRPIGSKGHGPAGLVQRMKGEGDGSQTKGIRPYGSGQAQDYTGLRGRGLRASSELLLRTHAWRWNSSRQRAYELFSHSLAADPPPPQEGRRRRTHRHTHRRTHANSYAQPRERWLALWCGRALT